MAKIRVAVALETFAEHGRSVIRGVASYLERGCDWELYTIPSGRTDGAILQAAMQADGVITRLHSDELIQVARQARTPLVAVHYRGALPIHTVCSNSQKVAEMVAEHLIAQGFRRFAFFGPDRPFSLERDAEFQKTIRDRGYECFSYRAGQPDPETFGWNAHDPNLVRWLRELPKPIGILTANDVMGQQLLMSAPEAGVRIPDEAAVVGVDNDELVCRLTSPPLSSVDDAGERIGYEAAEMLDNLVQDPRIPPRKILIDPARLVVRQSSDVLAVSDAAVADAVRFIRQNMARNLNVEDVIKEVPMARRTLEQAFRKLLGRSIREEIIDSRIRRAKQMLVETDLPIPHITQACGFTNRTHLGAIFKKHTGHAPAAYRREFRMCR